MPVEQISVGVNWGILKLEGTWKPSDEERRASWEMYVELVTRVTTQELAREEGLLREALTSIYSLFETTRKILRKYGPNVAHPMEGPLSLGYLSIAILNHVLRPFLSKWHPLLLDWETERNEKTSRVDHERKWEKFDELHTELKKVQESLMEYANLLAEAAEVLPLHEMEP